MPRKLRRSSDSGARRDGKIQGLPRSARPRASKFSIPKSRRSNITSPIIATPSKRDSRFNPEHPTSLLYEKVGDGYRLEGVMYTAPKRFTEDDLNERIPLSIAQWHEHVNFCRAPEGQRGEGLRPNPKFGLRGSIVTKEECDANGGQFYPIVFNWMVHLYPLEKDSAADLVGRSPARGLRHRAWHHRASENHDLRPNIARWPVTRSPNPR